MKENQGFDLSKKIRPDSHINYLRIINVPDVREAVRRLKEEVVEVKGEILLPHEIEEKIDNIFGADLK